jgi:serine phosphatase RsbU (regulator of sigma subunit)
MLPGRFKEASVKNAWPRGPALIGEPRIPVSGSGGPITRDEIEEARRIQRKLFPIAPSLPGFDIAGACYPAQATAGDCFDFIPLVDDSLGIAIGDVSGHGLGPALLMSATHAYLRAFAQVHPDVGNILAAVNRELAEDVEEGRFVTLLLARLEPQTRDLVYASAGHSMGYVLDRAGKVKGLLRRTGWPLGIDPESSFPVAAPLRLEPGELVLLATDGLLEAEAPDGTAFGVEGILECLRAHWQESAQGLVEILYRTARDHCQGRPQRDDMTAIVVKCL